MGVASPGQWPGSALPEVAFAGRSNVGKSSLINALTGRKAIARTSRTPGRTQQINLFDLGGKLMLADMPGYGFAKVSKNQKQEWADLIADYLKNRASLRCVFVLVDARRGLMDSDREFMTLLGRFAVPCRITLTKADKIKPRELEDVVSTMQAELKIYATAFPEILATSAEEKRGIAELRETITGYL